MKFHNRIGKNIVKAYKKKPRRYPVDAKKVLDIIKKK